MAGMRWRGSEAALRMAVREPGDMDDTTPEQLEQALAATAAATAGAAATTPAGRAAMLRACADALDAAAGELVPLAIDETHLTEGRLTGELARSTFQLRFFAEAVTDGSCFGAVIETAEPDFALGPRPDLRRLLEPIGAVLVFAASNFPFAFSVAGGDTAAALAAGCPVLVKAHHGHPRLSARVGELLADAAAPVEVVHGVEAGRNALLDGRIKAAAFTGSTVGGRALYDLAATRPDPIPFFGELGSVNPAFVSPGAVAARGEQVVEGFVGSFTLGVGQFCTKPGLLFLPAGHGLTDRLAAAVGDVGSAPMLGEWVERRYLETLDERRSHAGVRTLQAGDGTAPTLLAAPLATFADEIALLGDECFGPTALVVEYDDEGGLAAAAASVEGSLTATLHIEPGEEAWARPLLDALRPRAGRIVVTGWPTGVAVSPAMHHGGPWPAATLPLHSSVGGNSIDRFLTPTCYQNVPDALLPPALQAANPLDIRRRVDGDWA